ncbi:MAG: ATP-binding protein, partial [Oscillospiraceae bacterium]|nr:ATP-binding protein [Oscillospiraceae bacterium]
YDTFGNIRKRQHWDGPSDIVSPRTMTFSYDYDLWPDLLTAVNGRPIMYDRSGNPALWHDGREFTWERGRQLTHIQPGEASPPDVLEVEFEYDVNGIRTHKIVTHPDGTYTNHTFYTQGGRIVAERREFSDDRVHTLEFFYDEAGRPLQMRFFNGRGVDRVFNYVLNLQGDVIQIRYAGTGEVYASYLYNAWGELLQANNYRTQSGNLRLADINPIRYRGGNMKLSKIEIVNYRSIANVSIFPNPTCQGFVGINESGKTNILSAISLLSPDIELNKNDARMEGTNEERNLESYFEFYFKLSKAEMKQIVDDTLASIYHEASLPKITFPDKKVSISDFFRTKDTGLYYCNIENETKYPRWYHLHENEVVPIPWLKKLSAEVKTPAIESNAGKTISLSQYWFVEAGGISSENIALFEDCTTKDLNDILFRTKLTHYVENNIPNVVYWKYDNNYLLPNSVSLETFKKDPNSCIPLKSMFNLAGYTEIGDLISDAQTGRANKLTSILHKVSEQSTKYLQSIWKGYKSVCFELRPNGSSIDIHIKDSENFYSCEQRSDGFKRFVTFLLMLSARVSSGEISDSIIVIDEPDLGLHIMGQKNLLQELIKISKNNLVFYSTHSIFMIDKKEPSRHFVVSKEREVTTIKQVDKSNYTDDEVLYNALGYSIFETLQLQNIIFEGWSDKKLFECALGTKQGKKISGFESVGNIHSTGVKGIIGIAKTLELANRVYCVVSDSDRPAIEKRKEYQEKEQCEGAWYTYSEFVDGVHTAEDFIRHSFFKKSIEQAKPKKRKY